METNFGLNASGEHATEHDPRGDADSGTRPVAPATDASVNSRAELRAIREAFARVEAEAKATSAAQNRAHAEARARDLAETRAAVEREASAAAHERARIEEAAIHSQRRARGLAVAPSSYRCVGQSATCPTDLSPQGWPVFAGTSGGVTGSSGGGMARARACRRHRAGVPSRYMSNPHGTTP